MKRVLILGVNGFIGHHLSQRIVADTDWEIYGMDMQSDRVAELLPEKRFHFFEGDITINKEWIEYHIKKCDTVLPLVAIATPATYVKEPLRVFELDFEANLPIVRALRAAPEADRLPVDLRGLRDVRATTSSTRSAPPVLGPINKPRWIYSCAKQLMDRVIHAYGMQEGLDYTLFRPFNWIGAGLDSINTAKEGSSRVITQFLGHIVRGEPIKLVDGGTQKRAFTYIDDGIAALMKIVANKDVDRRRQDLQHRQPGEQFLGARAGDDDARPRAHLSRIPRDGGARAHRRDHRRRVLRQRLPGRAESRAEDRQHVRGPRLAAARADGRGAQTHLRRVSRAGGDRAPARRVSASLALKIDVDTLRGTREGVPRLVTLLKKHGAGATFLFSLGPDHTGRAIKRIFRPGFFGKVRRTSVVRHYGVKTLLYGTVLPGPDIGRRAADVMRATRDAGFEMGIHTWDHVRWQDGVSRAERRMDAGGNAARLRALHRDLRNRAARARRRRLADERPRAPPHAASGLRVLLGRARHAPPSCRCGTRSSSAARSFPRRCRRSTS